MKIIIMNNSGVSKITAELTSYDTIRKHYNCEVWDLSHFYDKKGTFVNIEEALSVENISEFEQRIQELATKDRVVVVTNMVLSAYSKVYYILKKYGVVVIDVQKNNFMSFLERKTAFNFKIKLPVKERVKRILNNYRVVRYLDKLQKYHGIKFDYFLSAFNFSPEEVKEFVKTHNVKYDEYLKYKDSDSPETGEYILFIDSATCYHPVDYKGEDPNFDVQHHLAQLNQYFDFLERKYSVPVIISLHPCSFGHLTESTFNGRKLTYSETAYYIQHAKFVVSFFSTSLINVVLAHKPSLILTSDEVEKSRRGKQEECAFAFAKLCDFTIDSMDEPVFPDPIVNSEKYDKFINSYLVNEEKSNSSNAEMIIELLKIIESKSC